MRIKTKPDNGRRSRLAAAVSEDARRKPTPGVRAGLRTRKIQRYARSTPSAEAQARTGAGDAQKRLDAAAPESQLHVVKSGASGAQVILGKDPELKQFTADGRMAKSRSWIGTGRPGPGRPKGYAEARNTRVREAIAHVLDMAAPQFLEWMQEVYVVEGPLVALKVASDLVEYCVPKLARTEITGKDGGAIHIADDRRRELLTELENNIALITARRAESEKHDLN